MRPQLLIYPAMLLFHNNNSESCDFMWKSLFLGNLLTPGVVIEKQLNKKVYVNGSCYCANSGK